MFRQSCLQDILPFWHNLPFLLPSYALGTRLVFEVYPENVLIYVSIFSYLFNLKLYLALFLFCLLNKLYNRTTMENITSMNEKLNLKICAHIFKLVITLPCKTRERNAVYLFLFSDFLYHITSPYILHVCNVITLSIFTRFSFWRNYGRKQWGIHRRHFPSTFFNVHFKCLFY